ncbi:hypothetical Protein YC6258_00003 [Gynuella sunshinyii YC6258]|nr:hypothetical Protein YC6258_00003 [Gynuella sunshinyii YC6258]
MHGMNKEDFQKEWNMIARFMDKQQSIPPCLHLIISNNQKTGEDIWYKPMPKERIFNPPLCPPGAP